MTTIYRVEDCDGVGPYMSYKELHNEMYMQLPAEHHNRESGRPGPGYDSHLFSQMTAAGYDLDELHYGFDSMEKLLAWFPACTGCNDSERSSHFCI